MKDHDIEKRVREELERGWYESDIPLPVIYRALINQIDATRKERDEAQRIRGIYAECFEGLEKERDALKEKLDQWECRDETGVAMAKLKQENAELNEEVEQLKKQLDRKDDRIDELKEWLARV